MPANALKRVVLPVFGLPTKATVVVRTRTICNRPFSDGSAEPRGSAEPSLNNRIVSAEGDANSGCFAAAEAEAVIAQTDFDWVAKWGDVDYLDLFSFQQAHLQQPLHEGVASSDRVDRGLLADLQLIEGRHAHLVLEIARLCGDRPRTDENAHTGFVTET